MTFRSSTLKSSFSSSLSFQCSLIVHSFFMISSSRDTLMRQTAIEPQDTALSTLRRSFLQQTLGISFPYEPRETIPNFVSVVVSPFLPGIIIALVCLISVPGPTFGKGVPTALTWRRKLWEWAYLVDGRGSRERWSRLGLHSSRPPRGISFR